MGRPQSLDPEQQRVDDGRERRELADKINAAIEAIEARSQRVRDAIANHDKVINAARSEIGTAKRELALAVESYEKLRLRALELLPSRDAPATREIEVTVHG